MNKLVAVLPGDGIGPEIVSQAVRVLKELNLGLEFEELPVGGAAYDQFGHPLPEQTLELANRSQAVLFGAVGDWKYDSLDRELRPEQAILGLRKNLGLFANLRPAFLYPELAQASTLKPEVVSGLDIVIVRELTGDVYFGKPRGIRDLPNGESEGFDTMCYRESEVERIAHIAFKTASFRSKKLCSVDKANVLETSQLWRDVVIKVSKQYPDVMLSHMYIDNAAMQLVRAPKDFDVILTGNLFGDILSDEASMLTGSIGMLPSASLNSSSQGLYEPSHGSAPDIAGQNKANPLATILSAALMLRYSFKMEDEAKRLESAVAEVIKEGYRTLDIVSNEDSQNIVGTVEMADAVISKLSK
ncbi:3-isopropylmalate dehydrogenase [Taylorella equigenitalis]|uniref:3-isopropylmalate dehydrogenase n=3 Tax=Taylorella equigenitalis TaxID=29575 RepID=A0A654KJ16_TAYEM|nr:3-isopropylmalate dehydrogenase [Taylorella equigenitalis]ADU92395.1 3-isopropylmalate dehydrogenase [Taylorella equigenitalis MCE9]AFN35949.1 3-isopropylmalate dehydrogenase [Taylorella equigenitalis ATCC 35865]ASY39358.1 3-isopropylmalate dehydrogenase [Taylorella equigenitalis]WDU45733.1 3-isopropylmalate dehydrogenase [Taylorella equigenitalis]WDU51194.1 3-isopropylmalate dehydrogenase [Taylorella equigenitalis]